MQEVFQKIFASGLWGCGFGGGSAFARRGLELLIYAAAACTSAEPIHVIIRVVPNRN